MPWVLGLDEAGYGPNLGPLVMTCAGCRLPAGRPISDLWQVLRPVARRHGDFCDDRIVVADSKLVYSPGRGIAALEQTVHALLPLPEPCQVSHLIARVSPRCQAEIGQEVWYTGATRLPLKADAKQCGLVRKTFLDHCHGMGIEWGHVKCQVVCAPRFNAAVDAWGTKGAVLAFCLQELLRGLPSDDEPVFVFADKHGGRNTYWDMVQSAFDGDLVLALEESNQRSSYTVADGQRQVSITFQPRAECAHFCVALASMVSKYVRETLMVEFNQFWQSQVPGLKATAGYPLDAKRFWADIRARALAMGIEHNSVWRQK